MYGTPVFIQYDNSLRKLVVLHCSIWKLQIAEICWPLPMTGTGEWVTDNISLVSANRETFVAQCATTSSGTYAVYYRLGCMF